MIAVYEKRWAANNSLVNIDTLPTATALALRFRVFIMI